MEVGTKQIALFDLDGTLLPWDTQCLFSNFVLRKQGWRRLLFLFYIALLPLYILRLISETTMKRAYLVYLWGLKDSLIQSYAKEFAQEVVQDWSYEEMRKRVEAHLSRGDETWLVTASPSVYAKEIANAFGFTKVLCTEVAQFSSFPLMPNLTFGNNKGSVKVDRLNDMKVIGQNDEIPVSAYSDSMADMPMLLIADHKVLVNPSERLVTSCGEGDVEVLRFERPWNTPAQKLCLIALYFLGLRKK